MADHGGVVAGCPGERTTVAGLLLDVAHDRTLRALCDGQDVADSELRLLSTVDEGASVEALSRDEGLLAELVSVRVAENDTGKGCTTGLRQGNGCLKWHRLHAPTSIVDDLLYNTLDITIALCKVERTELCWRLVVVRVRLELWVA